MINYVKTKIKPFVDPNSNEVYSWHFGSEGTCSESGQKAYIDAVWDVSNEELKRYMFWTKAEIDLAYGKCADVNDFDATIVRKIDAKCAKKVEVSDFDYNSL